MTRFAPTALAIILSVAPALAGSNLSADALHVSKATNVKMRIDVGTNEQRDALRRGAHDTNDGDTMMNVSLQDTVRKRRQSIHSATSMLKKIRESERNISSNF